MSNVIANMSVSLDGFASGVNATADTPLGANGSALFEWFGSGDTEYTMPDGAMVFKVSSQSAQVLRERAATAGCFITGRKTFDLVNGWNGQHPLNVPVVVVTSNTPDTWIKQHPNAPFTFVPEGIKEAVNKAKTLAGAKNVLIGTADSMQQALEKRLLDEIHIDLVPVLLGSGVRYFADSQKTEHRLMPIETIATPSVSHLTYRVVN